MANETTENELNQTGEPGTEYFMETLPGQDRYVAPLDETPLQDVDSDFGKAVKKLLASQKFKDAIAKSEIGRAHV